MRRRAAWLGAIVAIGPLMGPAFAKTTQIGEVVPKFEFKDIRYLRRTLSDLGDHKGFALVFLNTDCPVSQRFLPKLRELDAALYRARAFSSWASFVRLKIPSWRWLRLPWRTNCAFRS